MCEALKLASMTLRAIESGIAGEKLWSLGSIKGRFKGGQVVVGKHTHAH